MAVGAKLAGQGVVVTLIPVVPAIGVTKVANPTTRPAPGGTFVFTVTVANASPNDPVTITSLVDDVYGDLNGKGSCVVGAILASNGATYTCSFSGLFAGKAGDSQTDSLIVTAVDAAGERATSTAKATVSVTTAQPTLTTRASPTLVLLGAPVHDTATLAGATNPTGTITFKLYGPGDTRCAGPAVTTSTATVTGNGSYDSATFTPTATGVYRWAADYSGDAANAASSSPCNAPDEAVTVQPFVNPPCTTTLTGDVRGPVIVASGQSVCIVNARVVGPVTVNAGGALSVTSSQITGGIVADAPAFFNLCGSRVSGPSTVAGRGVVVTNATVPIRIGDAANDCGPNRVAGDVTLTTNRGGLILGANIVSGNVTVNNNTIGSDVVKANTIFRVLACAGNNPPPTNAGQPNSAGGGKTGQCAPL